MFFIQSSGYKLCEYDQTQESCTPVDGAPASYYNTYDDSEKRHWLVSTGSKIYRQNDAGEFELTDDSKTFRHIHARGGNAIAIHSSTYDIYTWDPKWETWNVVKALEGKRDYYSCFYNWDMSIMCNDTSGYHWIVDLE